MTNRQRFRRKESTQVVAVQLSLQTDGLTYQKWGNRQRAKQGDWLVNNGGDTYTVDQQSFAQSYRQVSKGIFEKMSDVWALKAREAGVVSTKEGQTTYEAGDYLVSSDLAGKDIYAISAAKFHQLYEPADPVQPSR